MIESPGETEAVLYPLQDAANRVGNEVEKFAEFLDGYNPLRVTDGDERREMAFDLIELYHKTALDTLDRLRDRHESEVVVEDGREDAREQHLKRQGGSGDQPDGDQDSRRGSESHRGDVSHPPARERRVGRAACGLCTRWRSRTDGAAP